MYYFLFAPNNSGTTVMSQTVAASCDGYLPPFGNNEGQMMPGVKQLMRVDAWAEEPKDYVYIRSIWDRFLAESGKSIFVEGSPPNLMHVARIQEVFPEHKAVFSMCSPWQQIASHTKNYSYPPVSNNLERYTKFWIFRAIRQARNRDRHPDIPYVKYETFCADPSRLTQAFGIENTTRGVSGKATTMIDGIRDLSMKTRAFLTLYEAERISKMLAEHRGVMDTLEYPIEDFEMLSARYVAETAQVHAGGVDRARWEANPEPTRARKLASNMNLQVHRGVKKAKKLFS